MMHRRAMGESVNGPRVPSVSSSLFASVCLVGGSGAPTSRNSRNCAQQCSQLCAMRHFGNYSPPRPPPPPPLLPPLPPKREKETRSRNDDTRKARWGTSCLSASPLARRRKRKVNTRIRVYLLHGMYIISGRSSDDDERRGEKRDGRGSSGAREKYTAGESRNARNNRRWRVAYPP